MQKGGIHMRVRQEVCMFMQIWFFYNSSGECLDMKLRCNSIIDCPYDEGDEAACEKVLLTDTYNKHASPNTADTNEDGEYIIRKVWLNCNTKYLSSLNILQISGPG